MPDGGAIDLSKIFAITELRDMQAWSNPVVGEKEFVKSGLAFEVIAPPVSICHYVDDVGEEAHHDLKAAWIAFCSESESRD